MKRVPTASRSAVGEGKAIICRCLCVRLRWSRWGEGSLRELRRGMPVAERGKPGQGQALPLHGGGG